jgi:hypothetical protein
MPIHPLNGRRLRVLRTERDRHGGQYLTVEHPTGFWLRLPATWTDRGAPPAPPQLGGREVRLSITGLIRLGRAVHAMLDEKVARAESAPILATRSESDRDATVAAPGTTRAVSDHTTERDRGTGDAGAQGPARGQRARRRGDS